MLELTPKRKPTLFSRVGSYALFIFEMVLAYAIIGLFIDFDEFASKLSNPASTWLDALGTLGIMVVVWSIVFFPIFFGVEFLAHKARQLRKA